MMKARKYKREIREGPGRDRNGGQTCSSIVNEK